MSLIIKMKVIIVKEEREPQLKSRRKIWILYIQYMIYVDLAPIVVLIWSVVVRTADGLQEVPMGNS
jgi:hypothetical protein